MLIYQPFLMMLVVLIHMTLFGSLQGAGIDISGQPECLHASNQMLYGFERYLVARQIAAISGSVAVASHDCKSIISGSKVEQGGGLIYQPFLMT